MQKEREVLHRASRSSRQVGGAHPQSAPFTAAEELRDQQPAGSLRLRLHHG